MPEHGSLPFPMLPSPTRRSRRGAAGQAIANPVPEVSFPEELPISARRLEIGEAIRAHQVVIVCGETGSGKTTQLPKICLSLGRGLGAGGAGLIGHTQPRRIAASSTAKRIAQELGSPLGEHVGFKIRFHDQISPGASVKLMTDGILLAETQGDPFLTAYDTLIIDEAHERSLNIDFLLGYLKEVLPRRPELKLIITSATIDAQRFARYFAAGSKMPPTIEVSGRLYPVETRYRPVALEGGTADLIEAILDAVDEASQIGDGDILVFLPGEREIREAAQALRKHHPDETEILPLFARLSTAEQERVFKPSGRRRIVLATNVAETSLTVPGIRFVVDTGLARVKRYSYRNKVEQLQTEPISQAAANQRAGRCGRVVAGVCIRLFDEADFSGRTQYSEPEILRASLAAVTLRMKFLGLGAIEAFPFLDVPSGRAIADGYQLLAELGALDEDNELTAQGRQLASLPLDPRIGRMILAAREHDCLTEMLILASALSVQDPRERPHSQQEAADLSHRQFVHEKSEFLADLAVWKWFEAAIEHKKSKRQLADACREKFLSQTRLREWRDVHSQLLTIATEHGWRLNGSAATYEQIHLALLTGLLGNVGLKSDADAHYLGARGIKFFSWPGSTLAKKGGPWVVAAELVETSRLYARKLARIEPQWLERVGAHLVKRSYSEPHWEKKAAQVTAFERGTLYGLILYAQRRVDFGRQDPITARLIFIRDGLVAAMRGEEFYANTSEVKRLFAHNRGEIARIEQLEHKARRPDVLVDDTLIAALYEEIVPAHVNNARTFEQWYVTTAAENPRLLYLDQHDLMRHEAAGVTTELFPKTVVMGGVPMALDYHFEPGSMRDGVTMTVPLFALNQVDATRMEWLVPGMLEEKVQLLLKSLPQKLRRLCVPLASYAERFAQLIAPSEGRYGSLVEALIADMRSHLGHQVLASDFRPESLPAHLTMNFKIVDEHERQLAMGRNLAILRAEFGPAAQKQFQQAFAKAATLSAKPVDAAIALTVREVAKDPSRSDAKGLSTWSFGELPELMEITKGGHTLVGYPALVDRGTDVEIEVFDDSALASRAHLAGLRRLFLIELKEPVKYVEKNLPGLIQIALQFMPLGSLEELREQIVWHAVDRACLGIPLPKNAEQFATRAGEGRARLALVANEITRLVAQILDEFMVVRKKLNGIKAHASAYTDMGVQLDRLVHKRFVIETPYAHLAHLPRYLKAMANRVDKIKVDPARDLRQMSEIAPLMQGWQRARNARKGMEDSGLEEFRWLLEELRVALFAQELRTPMPVSVKRLQKIWQSHAS